jgi:hypothetical protein
MNRAVRHIFVGLVAIPLAGCGLRTPDIVLSDDPNATSFLVNDIVNHIRCELKYAVRYAVWYDTANAQQQSDKKRRIPWIEKWGAKLALKLVIKEKSSLNPGVSIIGPLPNSVKKFAENSVTFGQSFTTGIGASASTQATRTVNLDFYYDFASQFLGADFDRRSPPQQCTPPGDFLVDGDLERDEI